MREIMNMSAVQNPEILREIIDRNPELGHILNDSNTLRQTLEAARNPELMHEMMRNTDRSMSNIDSSPEGFNMLRRMYKTVQEPFFSATTAGDTGGNLGSNPFAAFLGTQGRGQGRDQSTNPSVIGADTATGSPVPNSNPLPNRWTSASGIDIVSPTVIPCNTAILAMFFRDVNNKTGIFLAADTRATRLNDLTGREAEPAGEMFSQSIPIGDKLYQGELQNDHTCKILQVTYEIRVAIAGKLKLGREIVQAVQACFAQHQKPAVSEIAKKCHEYALLWKEDYGDLFFFTILVAGFGKEGPGIWKIHYQNTTGEMHINEIISKGDGGSGGDFALTHLDQRYSEAGYHENAILNWEIARAWFLEASSVGCENDFFTGPNFELHTMTWKGLRNKEGLLIMEERLEV